MSDLPLDQVRTLLAVVDERSFDAAAAVLHVTPSAVSQRVKALEQRVGRVLLLRTKPVRLTESGKVIVRFARTVAHLEQDTRSELGLGEHGTRTLAIAVNSDSLATWLLPALARVPEHLGICFDLQREDQDHTAALLREGLVTAAVTAAPHPVQGCTSRRLGRMRYRAMATPQFVTRWLADGPLTHQLPTAPMIVFDRNDDLQDRFLRALTRRRAFTPVRHHIPASQSFVDAVVAGLGWGMVPEAQAAPLGGALVDLAPDRPLDVPLHWQQWKLDSPALAAVAGAVVQGAKQALR
ncbi:chromosome replication initiation inhibitor protein [Kibdelosporangium phytohabitans]|uniref:HTH-type transcriptional regulator LysG n=2 Tax=Kibdelosporangium phytohabitans TaxID=860235 RepID=A0A0N9I6Q4_9PSEU|nr:LysR family transcriptional regulator ArgP [Kibdelosporangium phytohabitans]ALG10139.1 chromosome replication initiation inhibitor protein [Kibdelosporangium phytohabitans]